MEKEIDILINMTESLLKTTTEAYNLKDADFYNHIYPEINKIIKKINDSKYGGLFDFTELKYYEYPNKSKMMSAISVLRQIQSYLESITGQDIAIIKKLENKNKSLTKEIKDIKNKEKDYIEIIKYSRNTSEYPVDESKIKKFKGNNLKLINEALSSYSVGAYTACTCICRNILQDIVQTACKLNNITEGSLKAQIEKLVENGIIKSKHHSSIIDLSKFFGHRAAHPTTEVFSKEKANLVLSSLFIINEEVFNNDL